MSTLITFDKSRIRPRNFRDICAVANSFRKFSGQLAKFSAGFSYFSSRTVFVNLVVNQLNLVLNSVNLVEKQMIVIINARC